MKEICVVLMYVSYLQVSEVSCDALDAKHDYKLNFTETTSKLGLKCEVHEVITEDGYILQMFHIPGKSSQPVFLLSGNMGSADDYIARGRTSLTAVLSDAGHDVWVGNWRGCKYGRRHLTLDPDLHNEFWEFSYHEYAMYDVPAQIDYILNATGSNSVACIAWSLGTTTFYVMGAIKPEYVDKVSVVISLAPYGYSYHSVPLNALLPLYPIYESILEMWNVQELLSNNSTFFTALRHICCSEQFGFELCMKGLLFPASGFDEENLEPEFTPMLFGRFPSSFSRQTLRHLVQGLKEQRIAYFDYGPVQNLVKYGSVVAPEYPLHMNTMRVVLISGLNDLVSTLPDVELLKKQLPNVVEHIVLESEEFSHFDFVFGKSSHEQLYNKYILGILKKYFL